MTLASPFMIFMFNQVLPNTGNTWTTSWNSLVCAERVEFLPVPVQSLTGTMTFNPMLGLGKIESHKTRALFALPFLFSAISPWITEYTASPPSHLLELPVVLIWMIEGSRSPAICSTPSRRFLSTNAFMMLINIMQDSYFQHIILSLRSYPFV
jgi:hypothetical protein